MIILNLKRVLDLTNSKLIDSNKDGNVYYLNTDCSFSCSIPDVSNMYIFPKYTWIIKTNKAENRYNYPGNTTFNKITDHKEHFLNYCSSNYTLLSAISISNTPNNKGLWSEVETHYFLKKYNKNLFKNMHFAKTETLGYAIKNWNFVPNLFTNNTLLHDQKISNYTYFKYDNSLSLNQGLGCGNLISSTIDLANVLLHLFKKNISGIIPTFIDYYILYNNRNIKINYPYMSLILNNTGIINPVMSDAIYTTGLSQYNLTEYPSESSDKTSTWENTDGNLYWGHEGESYGVSSFLLGGYDLSSKYIITACATINLEGGHIVDRICQTVLRILVKDPSNSSENIKKIKEFIINDSYDLDKDYSYYGLNDESNNTIYNPIYFDGDIYFSLSYYIHDISNNKDISTNITYRTKENSWRDASINDPSYSTMKYNYGSCSSKLCTALNTIIMVNDLCNNYYSTDTSAVAIELFEKINTTTAYDLLKNNNNTTDNYLYHNPIYSEKPTSPSGFKDLFIHTFYKNNINDPAMDTKWLSLKRLMYMNTPLNDFDVYKPLLMSKESVCPTVKLPTTCDCNGGDVTFVGSLDISMSNGILKCNNSKGLNTHFGPFEWLQMANTCITVDPVRSKGTWGCDNSCAKAGTPSVNKWLSQYLCKEECKLTSYTCDEHDGLCVAVDGGEYKTLQSCIDSGCGQ